MSRNSNAGGIDESFVTVGTPLPAITSSKGKDVGGFVPVWEQTVVDEKGRRRFHGAFTGGWTAGFHGTVGSKEGWAPSTFTSSRASRDKGSKQTARDFMDEEDLEELANNRQINTSAQFDTYDPLLGNYPKDSAAGATAALASLIEPSSSRVGAQLMRRMGWREGQGIGPRLTYQQRRKQAVELGIKLDDDLEDEEASKHYFAPLDRPLTIVLDMSLANDRSWGLGYSAGPSLRGQKTNKKDAAYGGAVFEMGEDEDNVYDQSSEKVTGLSVVDIDEDGEGPILLGSQNRDQSKRKKTERKVAQPSVFLDGLPVLSGFRIAAKPLANDLSSLPPAQPPKDWKPNPSRFWKLETESAAQPGPQGQLDATDRGNLLGEPKVQKSVFDYLSTKDRERLASISQLKPGAASSVEQDEVMSIPPLELATASAALKGFQPFSATSTSPDEIKQARYTLYLQYSAGLLPNDAFPFGPRKLAGDRIQSMSDFNKELVDYSRAALVFKPLSGMLSGRFTSSIGAVQGPKVIPGLFQPTSADKKTYLDDETAPLKEEEEEKTPAQKAARAGLFGRMTRTIDSFRPNKLLCKRFGVQDPWAGESEDGVGGAWKEATATGFGRPVDTRTTEALNQSTMDSILKDSGFKKTEKEHKDLEESVIGQVLNVRKPVEVPTLESVGLGDDETQGQETLTYVKATQDIFDAVFGDSDDDDDEDSPATDVVARETNPVGAPLQKEYNRPKPIQEPISSLDGVVDLGSYRPTFNRKSAAATSKSTVESTDEKKKKKSKRKREKAILSFAFEGEASEEETSNNKKPKVEEKREEKLAPRPENETSGVKGRSKAADFM